jgi:hypothetical protein
MPVVSISVSPELFKDLEARMNGRSRSRTWSDYLEIGTDMEGHKCPACDHKGMKIHFNEEQTWPEGTVWMYDGKRWVESK